MIYIIVTGDRHAQWKPWAEIIRHAITVNTSSQPFHLVHGDARGIDRIASAVAREFAGAKVLAFPADWTAHGKAAGPIRNERMVAYVGDQLRPGDAAICLAFHDDIENSKGTRHMVSHARRVGLPVSVYGSDGRVR